AGPDGPAARPRRPGPPAASPPRAAAGTCAQTARLDWARFCPTRGHRHARPRAEHARARAGPRHASRPAAEARAADPVIHKSLSTNLDQDSLIKVRLLRT